MITLPQFGAVLAGDIGGRGRIGLQIFNEKAGEKLSEENASDVVQWKFTGKGFEEIIAGWAQTAADMVSSNRRYYEADKLRAAGFAFPGGVINGGIVSDGANMNENTAHHWNGTNLGAALSEKFKDVFEARGLSRTLADDFKVTVANDLVAGTLGERYNGAAADMKKGWLLVTTLGTGYGGATMMVTPNGGIVTPGEPGQKMSTRTKSVEDIVAGGGMLREAKAAGLDIDSPKELIEKTFLGGWTNDADLKKANRVIDNAIRALAASLAEFSHMVYLPRETGLQKKILIGGGVIEDFKNAFAGNIFMFRLKEAMQAKSYPSVFEQTDIAFTEHPNNLMGAAVLATLPDNPGLELMG